MSTILPTFRSGVVRPVECLQAGWQLIRGQYWLFLGITAVGLLIGSAAPLGIILGPMMCGIYLCLLRRMRGETVSFDMLFKGFDFFGESLIATLIQFVPMMLIIVPMYIGFFVIFFVSAASNRRGEPDPAIFVVMIPVFLIAILLIMLISAFFIFTFPLIADRNFRGFDAVKTSFKAVRSNFGGVLGLLVLTVLMGLLGMLLCYVGAFLVLPISMAGWAVAYRQVFPDETGTII